MKIILDFILITGIVLNIIALVGLFRLKQKLLPHYILIIFWIAILDIIIYFYANLHQLNVLSNISYYLEDGVRFFIPPLVFIYIKSILFNNSQLIKKSLFHFIPFIIYFTFYTVLESLSSDFLHIKLIDEYINWAVVQDIYGILYFFLSLKLFYGARKAIKESYSYNNNKDFLWLEKFLISFLIVLVIDLLITISEVSFGYSVSWDGYITVFFMIVAMVYIGYYGLTQSSIFLPFFLVQKHILNLEKDFRKKYYLNKSQKDVLRKKFIELMHEEKLYLVPNLNLKMLADKMMITQRTLSAFFNEVLDSNFYDSINTFRVDEAKSKLKSDEIINYSIEGIGLASGFSSKSSFYRVFKNKTTLSPLAYKKKAAKESHNSQ